MHRFLLLATAAMTLGACASSGAHSATPGEAFTLAPGASARLPDASTLRYVRVTQDSRCPPKVQCIRAGDADVVFEFTPAGGTASEVHVNLPESPKATIGSWRMELLTLEFGDAPRATVRVDAATP